MTRIKYGLANLSREGLESLVLDLNNCSDTVKSYVTSLFREQLSDSIISELTLNHTVDLETGLELLKQNDELRNKLIDEFFLLTSKS